jgi:hypothetical protein
MHGTEQSDSPIVPRKPVNKAAQAAAESAEGSGGTKRNADLQSTDRTQSRASVSQAQGRIREAVNNQRFRVTHSISHGQNSMESGTIPFHPTNSRVEAVIYRQALRSGQGGRPGFQPAG